MSFPLKNIEDNAAFERLWQAMGSIEKIEMFFQIEFSCGDGLFISDLQDDARLEEYDSKVDTVQSLPRHMRTNTLLGKDKPYTFKLVEYGRNGIKHGNTYHLNGKQTHDEEYHPG